MDHSWKEGVTLFATVARQRQARAVDPASRTGLAWPLPLRREARKRAMVRGEAEAMEYAANAGFARVQLLSVDEGVSYRSSDIVVTGSRIGQQGAPPPPPPMPERGGGIEPGQVETGVVLTLVYRMAK